MISIKANYIAATYNNTKKSLLTLSEKDMLNFIEEIIDETVSCNFTITQYHTTKDEFLKDLQKLTTEVINGA